MRVSAKNRGVALAAVAAIVAAALPDPLWARAALAVVGIIAVLFVMTLKEREDRRAGVERAVAKDENLDAHAVTHEELKRFNARLFRDQEEIVRTGSLVVRLRLLVTQLRAYAIDEQIQNPPPSVTIEQMPDGSLVNHGQEAIARWSDMRAQTMRTFKGAFAPRVAAALLEVGGIAAVQDVVSEARERAKCAEDEIDLIHLASNLNEIAMVIDGGKRVRP